MQHFTCDLCGTDLPRAKRERYVVRIEVAPAGDPNELTDADLEDDALEEISQVLQELEERGGDAPNAAPPVQRRRFDLCPTCQKRFLRDPLSKDALSRFDFSEN